MSVASGPKPAGRAGGMPAVSRPGRKAAAYIVKGLAAALFLGAAFNAGANIGILILQYTQNAMDEGPALLLALACVFLAALCVRANFLSLLALPFGFFLIGQMQVASRGLGFWPNHPRLAVETTLSYSAVILIVYVLARLLRFAVLFAYRKIARRRDV